MKLRDLSHLTLAGVVMLLATFTSIASAAEPSGADAKANWRPASTGPFYVVLREYSPGPAVLNGDWQPEKIAKAK